MNTVKIIHHGDTAYTAKVKNINHGEHGEHGGHGEKQKQRTISFLPFSVLSVSSVVNGFAFASRRVRRPTGISVGHVAVVSMGFVLAGCITTTPPTAVHQPMTVRPQAIAAGGSNGSIFSSVQSRPLFEDRHARMVGDVLTINIIENTAASKKSGTTAERSQTVAAAVPTITNLPFKGVGNLDLAANDSSKFSGKGENSSTNAFISTLTVTVIEVLPNGNLLVSGEKQIGLKEGEEFVRFSGVVNPSTITTANSVQSSQVADARIEYKANGFLDDSQAMGWLARFFLVVMPF